MPPQPSLQLGDLDLRTVVRPADRPIGAICDVLICTFGGCRGRGDNPPPLIGLFASKDDPVAEMEHRASEKLR